MLHSPEFPLPSKPPPTFSTKIMSFTAAENASISLTLQRELYIALGVMRWCARVCICVTKSAQGARKQIFGIWYKDSAQRGSTKMSKLCPWRRK